MAGRWREKLSWPRMRSVSIGSVVDFMERLSLDDSVAVAVNFEGFWHLVGGFYDSCLNLQWSFDMNIKNEVRLKTLRFGS
jgi:hypothetical protein